MYPEADREFAAAAAADPACALAHWGRAMAIIHPLWPDAPTEAERKQGAEHIRRGLASPPATARERAYLETLDRFFSATAPGDYVARLKLLDGAWADLAGQFPDDMDALAFSALFHLAPARFVAKDKSHRIQLEAAARLQKVSARIPDHPGAQHYKIHAYDFPLLADRALEVCDTYGSIAPDVPHALHMPTHIFTRRGLWEKSIDYNRRSAAAARRLGETAGALNGHYPHALDYMAYAHLQRGQYREADTIRRQVLAQTGPYSPVQPGAMAFAFAAIPARHALERQAWREAADLALHQPASFAWGKQFLHCDSIVHFARALGAARSGRIDDARKEIIAQERVHRELAGANRASYWAAQAETQLLAARAWVQFAGQKPDDAITLMRRAVELEATADKEAVTPGEVLPAGDLLGDMLIEAGRPADALAAFEAVLAASPNRLNTLYGAGLAAERAGNTEKARHYYEQLANVASEADAGISRVERARAFVAKSRADRAK
ncbi:MAG: tetratricopeptide repeat protein [Opitutaceae bacterium]|nr:tetratricopeptide repeat protein [Opitutaceae bacterium]